jgi:hypothetical protein
MSMDTFRAILAKVPKHVRIDFSGMAEPWANPDATGMLRHALQSGYNVSVYTTLYGMTEEDNSQTELLLRAYAQQVEVICIHLPDANGNMRGWKYDKQYETNLQRFFSLRGKVAYFEVMTMDGQGKVHPDLVHLGVPLGAWVGNTRAGNVVPPSGQPSGQTPHHNSAVVCSFTPYYDQNVVLPNGDVVLCCMDYSVKHRLGNLLEQDYFEIFSGGAIGELQSVNMRPAFSERSLCKSCDRARVLRVGTRKHFWVAD